MTPFLRLFGLALLLGACTDVDILLPEVEPPPPPEVKPNAIIGQFCTEDPATIVYPLKIWMIIDDSGSMNTNDPNQKRYTSMMDLATKLGQPGKVFFGGEVFSGEKTIRFSNPRFLDDVGIFNAQVAAVRNGGAGQTPYLGALNLAMGELTADIQENLALAKRTKYVVIMLSDGQPTDSQPPAILAAVETLMALKERVGGITLNTVFLGGDQAAAGLLQTMALKGEGIFKSFPNGDALDYTGFDFSTIRRSYQSRFFVATNVNMVPNGVTQVVDSDADSLPDDTELAMGLDPLKRDTDGDGCNDSLEIKVGWDPKTKKAGECTCAPPLTTTGDKDHDGLTDCEEGWLGTLAADPDSDIGKTTPTDGDLVSDGLDFFELKDATFNNTSTDRDLDGVLDIQELEQHTDPEHSDVDRERWAYRPALKQTETNERCFDFTVDNVTLGHTLATADHAADQNILEFHFAQSSRDDPHKDRIYRIARLKVPYAEGNAVIHVVPTDFSIVLGM